MGNSSPFGRQTKESSQALNTMKKGPAKRAPAAAPSVLPVLPVLPDADTEFFFSVAVVDGIARREQAPGGGGGGGGIGDRSPACAYRRSKFRERNLQWALHRGVRHGCQPALFWRTPFVEPPLPQVKEAKGKTTSHPSSESSAERAVLADVQPTGSESSPRSVLTRHLSQFAHDFVFDTNSSHDVEQGDSVTKGKGEHASKDQKRSILVYTVAPDHLSDQVELITGMWEEAAAPDAGFKVQIVPMRPSHFDEHKTCLPPRALESNEGSDVEAQGSVCSDNDDVKSISVEQLAALRGAGLLYGYPALVFDCNPLSMSCICSGTNGHVIGSGTGSGLNIKLQSKFRATCSADDGSERGRGIGIGAHHLDASFEETRDEVERGLGDATDEILASTRGIISRWIHRLQLPSPRDNNSSPSDTEALVSSEDVARAMANDRGHDEHHRHSSKPPIIESLYERRNEKRSVLTTGADSDLFSHLIGDSNKSKKSNNPALTISVARFDEQYDENKVYFPWADCPEASFPEMEGRNEARPISRPQRCAIIHHRHLIQHGVAASIMGHYVSHRYRNTVVGRRVAKRFPPVATAKKRKKGRAVTTSGGTIYRGSVGALHAPTDAYHDEKEWFLIEYDDGDSEHVAREELMEMLKLYAKVGEDDPKLAHDDVSKPAKDQSKERAAESDKVPPEPAKDQSKEGAAESEKGAEQEPKKRRRNVRYSDYYIW